MLEAMSCGLLALTSNEAFRDILSTKYFLEERTSEAVAKGLKRLSAEKRPSFELREIVVKNHSLSNLIPNIIKELKN